MKHIQKVQKENCKCASVVASAQGARVSGSGGLVNNGVLFVRLSRRFRFEMHCTGTAGPCVERVGVDADNMRVVLSDNQGNQSVLTPNAGTEQRTNAAFIILECNCKQEGGCTMIKSVEVLYEAQFDVPQWAIDDLTSRPRRRVMASVNATWTPLSETGFCPMATAAGFNATSTIQKQLRIKQQ